MQDSIIIKQAVLHILDNSSNVLAPSNKELLINSEIYEFLEKHILKLFGDSNIKNARFIEDESNSILEVCQHLQSTGGEDFLEASIFTAERLFEVMTAHVDIAPCDLICCLFDYNERPYYGILKLNYKTGFTHYVEPGEEGNVNTIIKYKTILPSESQKIDECALVCLEDFSLKILEKAYEINGKKDFYLSKIFLNCETDFSDNEKLKIIDKVSKKITKKFFDEDFETVAKFKKTVSESLEETGAIDVGEVAAEVFGNNMEIQNDYITEIEKAGLKDKTITVSEKTAERKYKSLKIKTDTGIEINLPPSYYDNKDVVEFINNPDGTISILIKNVGKLINK